VFSDQGRRRLLLSRIGRLIRAQKKTRRLVIGVFFIPVLARERHPTDPLIGTQNPVE
jgi:hypothetical protein